jgi:UDP-N-acetylmuramoyl-L-alanyl-D-glutamate--2,6-diaminopimelate ligase
MKTLGVLLEYLGACSVDGVDSKHVVVDVTKDSRTVVPGCVFIRTQAVQESFAQEALAKGALCVIGQDDCDQIKVDCAQKAYEQAVAWFYDSPAHKLKFWGVTGTNGKTTSAFIMHKILNQAGYPCALLGTVVQKTPLQSFASQLTTPGWKELNVFLAQALADGATHVVMEVSSHALEQNRVGNIVFDVAIFTNLTQDHLDYHGTMEQYFAAKRKLFLKLAPRGVAVINGDDPWCNQIKQEFPTTLAFSAKNAQADFYIEDQQYTPQGCQLQVKYMDDVMHVSSNLTGAFNGQNLAGVMLACLAKGIKKELLLEVVKDIQVPGRFETVFKDFNRYVILDYAHTPDALENVLTTAHGAFAGFRIVVLFGCGGDRDRTKRPLMGAIAQKYGDILYVTSDNPRTEDPTLIIQDIMTGLTGNMEHVHVIEDRRNAITSAIAHLESGDCLILAGKGHEDYQILGKNKVPFDEKAIVRVALQEVQCNWK